MHRWLQLAQRGCGRLHPRESKVGVGKGCKRGGGGPQTPEPLSHSMVLGKHWPTFFMRHPLSDSSSTCSGLTLSQGRMLAQQPVPAVSHVAENAGEEQAWTAWCGCAEAPGAGHHRRGHPPWPWKWSGGQADFLGEGVAEQRPDRMWQEGEQNK